MPVDNIYIILHQIKGSLNIGYAARAMLNTGFRHLRLSEPRCRIDTAAFRSAAAPRAHRILNSTPSFPSLKESLADLQVVVGTTARCRHRVKPEPLECAAPRILRLAHTSKIGILFGPEESGLTNEDMAHCDRLITIPSSPEFASYNVAHAVLLTCYTLMIIRASGIGTAEESGVVESLSTHEQRQGLFEDLRDLLERVGFHSGKNPTHILLELRALEGRLLLTEREVTLLRGICRKLRTAVRKSERF